MNKRRLTVKARGLAYLNGKVFAQRHKPYGDEMSRDWWCLPGGKLEPGEAIEEGLVRELVEETGVQPEVGRLLFVQQFSDDDANYIEFIFQISNPADFIEINLSETINGEQEIDECGFVDLGEVGFYPKFITELDLATYLKQNQPVKFYYF